jgi:N-acetylmuramoyl-L-alanine amidase
MEADRQAVSRLSRRVLLGEGIAALATIALLNWRHSPKPQQHSQTPNRSSLGALATRYGAPSPTATASAPITAATPAADKPVVFIDAGHGGVDQGAIGTSLDGQTVMEKTVTLALALKTKALLDATGYRVVLSRTADDLPGLESADLSPDGTSLTPDGVLADLQRRIDRANASGARLFISLHLNASDDPSARGTETYYDSTRPFASDNQRLATLVQRNVIESLHGKAYDTPDRGIIDDTILSTENLGTLPDSYNHLVLLGPEIPGQLRPTQMPGVLSEALFVTSPEEASAAITPQAQDLIAHGYAQAVIDFFAT